jgi:hypothetical protein
MIYSDFLARQPKAIRLADVEMNKTTLLLLHYQLRTMATLLVTLYALLLTPF